MSRASVRKVFVSGLVVGIVGAVLILLTTRGGGTPNAQLYNAGVLLAGIGGLIEVVSWILAMVSAAILGRWGWFAVLLILGLLGLLLIVMIVYSVAGPSNRRGFRRQPVVT